MRPREKSIILIVSISLLFVIGFSLIFGNRAPITSSSDYLITLETNLQKTPNISDKLYDEQNTIGEDQRYHYESNITSSSSDHPNVLLISLDGFSRERFYEYKDNLTTINGLLEKNWNLYNVTNYAYYTQTRNGHATMLSGYLGKETGVFGNIYVYNPLPPELTFLEKAEDKYGSENIATGFISGKYKNIFPAFNEMIFHNLDYVNIQEQTPEETADQAINFLEIYKGTWFTAFLHFRDPDKTGHLFREGSPEWVDSLFTVDEQLDRILNKLNETGALQNTLLYITTDHGFQVNGLAHPHEPYIWLLTNDAEADLNLYSKYIGVQDIAPSICYALDLPYNYSDNQNGQPLQLEYSSEKIAYRERYLLDKVPPILEVLQTQITIPGVYVRLNVSEDVDQLIVLSDPSDYEGSVISRYEVPLGSNTITISIDHLVFINYSKIYVVVYDAAENMSPIAKIKIR